MNLMRNSFELILKFIWTSYEFHMNKFDFFSYEIHKKFIWTSYEFHMNKFDFFSYEIYKKFIWTSYEVHNNFLRRSHKFHVKLCIYGFICASYEWASRSNVWKCQCKATVLSLIGIARGTHWSAQGTAYIKPFFSPHIGKACPLSWPK